MRMRAIAMLAAFAALSPVCSAYYYYVLLNNSGGQWTQVPAHFDLNSADTYGIPNNTVSYLISSEGPSALMPGDTFQAVISQIRAAANVWSSVSTSGIRLTYGGLSAMTGTDATPEIDVVFSDDVTPGLIALTVVTTATTAVTPTGGAPFVPIVNSQIQLQSNLGANGPFPQGSWSDQFFLTVAHEFGHALGLQHTKTSSLMTTSYTRTTTKAQPLGADDIAGVSLLYPAGGFLASTGSVSGAVTMNGNGVNLATVVALSANGAAVSALSNPDGTYQINGIPPGQYYVYTQPLPPPLQGESYPDNVRPPVDSSGNVYYANNGFRGQFYGGTNDWTQAPQVSVTAGNSTQQINFNVASSSGPSVYDLIVYAYIGNPQVGVQGPPLQSGGSDWLYLNALSATSSTGFLQFAPGLNISIIGGAAQFAPNTLGPYGSGSNFLIDAIWPGVVNSATPVAIAIAQNNDLYVLPAAFSVVQTSPVTVSSASGSTDNFGNATVTVRGSNLGPSSQIFFDGAPSTLVSANSDGSLTVSAPPAVNGYTASVEALNPDGQTSEETLGAANPAQFTYGGPAFPAISITSPANPAITAGTDMMVAITGYNTDFVSGEIAAGFGSSDVTVKQLWVVSAGMVVANLSASAAAPSESTTVTVASGLQFTTLPNPFAVVPASSTPMSLHAPIVNQATQLAGVPAGGIAVINTTGLPASLAGWVLTIGGQPAPFTFNGTQILASVPGGLLIGPESVELTSPAGAALPPLLMQVDEAPPVIVAVSSTPGAVTAASPGAQPGQNITLTVSGLADQYGNLPAPSAIDVSIGGVDVTPSSVTPLSAADAQLQVTVPAQLAMGSAQITVQVATRISAPFTISVQ